LQKLFICVFSTILKKDIATNKTPLSIVISFVGSWIYGHHKIENKVNFPTFS